MSDTLRPHRLYLPGSSVHGISQQEYWSGRPFSFPGNLPDLGIKPVSSTLADGFFTTESLGKPFACMTKDLFITIIFTKYNMSIFQQKKLQHTFKCEKHSLKKLNKHQNHRKVWQELWNFQTKNFLKSTLINMLKDFGWKT